MMKRRQAVAVMLQASVALAFSRDDFDDRVIRFNNLWNRFIRLHFGCGPDEIKVSECKPFNAVLAYREFSQAAREAQKLFAPEEK